MNKSMVKLHNRVYADYPLAIGVAAAFFVRLFFMQYRYCIQTDSVDYLSLAMNLFVGQGYLGFGGAFCNRTPFYSILIGLAWLITGDIEKAGYLVSIICGSLILVPVYYLAKKLFNRRIACISSILIIFYPYLIESSVDTLRDSTFNFLVVSGTYLFWKALRSYRLIPYLMVSLLFGLAYLTRIEGIIYIPLVIFLHILAGIRIYRMPLKRIIGFNLIFMLLFFIIAIPYLATVYHYTGRWSIGDKDVVFKKMFSPYYELSLTSSEIYAYEEKENAPGGFYRMWLIAKSSGKKFVKFLNEAYLFKISVWYQLLLVFLLGVGFFAKEWNLSRTRCQIFLIIMFIPLSSHFFHWVIPRYFLPFITISFIWVGNGIDEIYYWWIRARGILKIKKGTLLTRYWVFTGITIFLVILSFSPRLTQPIREDPYYRYWKEHREMGLWIRDNGITGEKILTVKPYIPFYSDLDGVYLADISYDELIRKARQEKIKYVIISERGLDWRMRRDRLKFLLDENNELEELKLVHIINPKKGYKILLYEVL